MKKHDNHERPEIILRRIGGNTEVNRPKYRGELVELLRKICQNY